MFHSFYYMVPSAFISRHTSPNSCIIVFSDSLLWSDVLKSKCKCAHCANALLLVGFFSIKYLDSLHRMMSLMTSFLYCGSIPVTSPLAGRPTLALEVDILRFTAVLQVLVFVFFPYSGGFLLPSFSTVFGLIIKITVVCKIKAKVRQVFCLCGVRMGIKSRILSLGWGNALIYRRK